jgi:hypothetical protein
MSLSALNTALYSRIGGTITNAGTNVYFLEAPDGQALPYVVWDYTADLDENKTPNRTRNSVLFIRSYGATQGDAGTLDGQIDALLHNKELTVTGWSNFWLMREGGYSLPETDAAGKTIFMVASEYRVRLGKT